MHTPSMHLARMQKLATKAARIVEGGGILVVATSPAHRQRLAARLVVYTVR